MVRHRASSLPDNCCSAGSNSISLSASSDNNDNPIRLQVLVGMIAYLLLRIAARVHRIALLPIRLAR